MNTKRYSEKDKEQRFRDGSGELTDIYKNLQL